MELLERKKKRLAEKEERERKRREKHAKYPVCYERGFRL